MPLLRNVGRDRLRWVMMEEISIAAACWRRSCKLGDDGHEVRSMGDDGNQRRRQELGFPSLGLLRVLGEDVG